ncbi:MULTISPECIES: DUF4290 domain-containing protein [Proteiniphilum]|uniref:DUF4290 domain-containing protein n=1 Tax=Proteiniphilum TaxID=294702 RepID=UPI001EE9CF90|nr:MULTISPECIES: DUF4290 domain-containing protein [Proteiniphilum]ULB36132.1 DUF4290 domain-containing protein [Proteiniphilum propionicum]
MRYNTQEKKLALPEYGRNIQNMVDHCVGIEDPEERKKCAYTVIDIMGNMFPHLRDVNNFKHILWDHLAIMSDFKLDIEYPYEIITREELNTAPGHLDYSRPSMQYRHYGKILDRMIKIAASMEDGDKKDHLLKLLLNQMKKSYTQWNKEVDDEKIFQDLYEMSGGKIKIDPAMYTISEVKVNTNRDKLKNIKFQRRK